MRINIKHRTILGGALLLWTLFPLEPKAAKRFFSDDPIQKDPAPSHVAKIASNSLSQASDFMRNTFSQQGERQSASRLIHAQGVNTLGEVPDSGWYTNRHYKTPMTIEELVRGAGDDPPSKEGKWKVVAAKTDGVSPGFRIEDAKGRSFLLKFDPVSNPEIATAADVITAKFLYALGYNVPENYIVYFDEDQLEVAKGDDGKDKVSSHLVAQILDRLPHDPQKGIRAMASRFISGDIAGPFLYYGTRADDPNDIVLHEHRRDLRGLFVFDAWLDHTDAKAINTLDTVVEDGNTRYVKHYLIDFGASLGSSTYAAKDAWLGHEYTLELKPALTQIVTLGLYVPEWARAHYPHLPSVGRFESDIFEPEKWKSNYPVPAFENRLPDDTFWAAKQVMAFTDEQIRAIVKTGEYSDPEAARYVADVLIARRDKIGKVFFAKVLPLDHFAVQDGRLKFEDLAAKYDLLPKSDYTVQWSLFDNDKEAKTPLPQENTFALPKRLMEGLGESYAAADIRGGDSKQSITVYVRRRADRVEVVGIDRAWSEI